jgi:hypothetical protein
VEEYRKEIGNLKTQILFTGIDRQKDFFDYISDHFEATYWIPRNQEYYQSDISNRSESFGEKVINSEIMCP